MQNSQRVHENFCSYLKSGHRSQLEAWAACGLLIIVSETAIVEKQYLQEINELRDKEVVLSIAKQMTSAKTAA